MATPVANVSPLAQAFAAPDVPATSSAQATSGKSPFLAILSEASGSARQAAASRAADAADAADANALDNTDNTTATDTGLGGLLALAAQILASPVNAAVTQATGQATTTTETAATPADATSTRARADELRLDRAGGTGGAFSVFTTAAAARNATVAAAATAPPAVPAPAAPTEPAPAVPTATPGELALSSAAAVALRGGTSNVPAQAPIVTNLLPTVPVPADPSVTNPPVGEPTAPLPATAVPSTELGDRPATTGDRFAALASAGAQLAASGPPRSAAFSNALTQEVGASAPTVGQPGPPAGSLLVNGPTAPDAVPVSGPAPAAEAVTPAAVPAPSAFGQAPAEDARLATVRAEVDLPSVLLNNQAPGGVAQPDALFPPVRPAERAEDARPADGTSTAPGAGALPPALALDRTSQAAATEAVRATPAAQVADAVVAHAHVFERNGNVEFQMRLDPPELGRLQVRLVTRGDEVHGQVLVASEAVRQVLESQLPELRQRLEAAGVNVQRFDVATDPNGGGNRNPYREAGGAEFAPRTAAPAVPPVPLARIGRPVTGSVDVTV